MKDTVLSQGFVCHRCDSLCVFCTGDGDNVGRACLHCGNTAMEACLPLTARQFQRMAALLGLAFRASSLAPSQPDAKGD